jgi:excisionase family DNA binding protein
MEELLRDYPPVLSVEDVATILKITPGTVRTLVKKRTISGVKVGRLIRVPKSNLIAYLDSPTQKTEN